MNTEIIQSDTATSFLDEFLKGAPEEKQIPNLLNQLFQKESSPTGEAVIKTEEEKKIEEEGSKEEKTVEELVKGEIKEETKEEYTPETLFDKLVEQGLAFPYEDGTKPTTWDEVAEVAKQSKELTRERELQEAWDNKVGAYSPQIQTILQFAEGGITKASELNEFITQVSHFEKVNELDPKNPQHQEQIVFLHLQNTGLNENEAKEQIDIIKENKLLDKTAEKFFPTVKKTYENEIRKSFQEQAARNEQVEQYVQNNAVNVQYFLENEESYLPFKLTKTQKIAVLDLAAKPLGVNEDHEPIYGYSEYLKQLQNGTEEQYKEFMEVMTFLADRKYYKEGLQKQASSKATETNFKKIAVPAGKVNNNNSQNYQGPTLQKKSNGPWSTT